MVSLLLVIALTSTELMLKLLKNPLVWVTALTSVVIPFLTAAVTRPTTPDKVKTFVSLVLAGVYGLVAWLGALNGNVDWKTALVVFVAAAAGAGGLNAAWVSGQIATWLGVRVPINVGPKPITPEKAAELHSNHSPLTIPVPLGVSQIKMDPAVQAAEQNPEELARIKDMLDNS
jgi:hypothetical protein